MSLEAHHRFILDTMQRNQDIARNIINELEAENARLKAEVERLTSEVSYDNRVQLHVDKLAGEFTQAEVERLQAEVERLRKAGDGLYKSMLEIGCNEMADNFQYDVWWGSMKAWNAAKEGKQP